MQLEDSNGKIVVPKSAAEVDQMLDRLGRDLDHCILSRIGFGNGLSVRGFYGPL